MKPTKQVIEKMEKEFRNTKFAKGGGLCFECCDYEEMWDDLEEFIESHTTTLLSAFAEEVIGKEEEILTAHELMTKNKSMNKSIADWEEGKQMGKSVLRAEQRLKAKEIISSIGK